MKPRGFTAVVIGGAIAALHYFLYLGLWGAAAAIGEGVPGTIPLWLRVCVAVLGAPLMHLPESWFVALRPVLGDDRNSLFVVAALNSMLWGIVLVSMFRHLIARRHARSGAATA
jgi:hypothetical protein